MRIYIFAPAGIVSGGPELAHQLCSAIEALTGYEAYMCYVNVTEIDLDNEYPIDMECPKVYEGYKTKHVINIQEIDKKENVVVIPEGLTYYCAGIQCAKKVLWWMSVDNYILTTKETNLKELEDTVDLHLLQSYYAKEYLEKKMKHPRMMFLTDYINLQHGQFLLPEIYRENIVLYNPKKGYECTKVLMEKISWIQWMPLINLSVEEMIIRMQMAKVYVDFGNHPGKDRIPREAAANGCCVITNKRGSAAFSEDVPIMEQYKFDNSLENIDEIERLLEDICENYGMHMKNFTEYRNWIKEEKQRFDAEVVEFVQVLEKF